VWWTDFRTTCSGGPIFSRSGYSRRIYVAVLVVLDLQARAQHGMKEVSERKACIQLYPCTAEQCVQQIDVGEINVTCDGAAGWMSHGWDTCPEFTLSG
jgi:hypothetical protein